MQRFNCSSLLSRFPRKHSRVLVNSFVRGTSSQKSFDNKKFYAQVYSKDQRYQSDYIDEMHKNAPRPELFDHYFNRAENIIKSIPSSNKSRSFSFTPFLVTVFIIGAGYFIIRKIGESLSTNISSPLSNTSVYKVVVGSDTRFEDVHGIDEVKEELSIIVEFLNNPQKFNDIGAKVPRGVLLYGPPGTGKTLLARAIAGEAKVPIIFANASSFEEVFVGLGSRRVKELFEKARKLGSCIIYIDEIDALASRRTQMNNNSNMAINQLLADLDGFEQNQGIVFIGSTNKLESLDPAILRPGRIDKLINVPLPDRKGRTRILDFYLDKIKRVENIDVTKLSSITIGFSGADLKNLVNQAAIIAVKENALEVTSLHIQHAFSEILMGIKRPLLLEGKEKQLVAYHEGGHAVVSYFTAEAPNIYQATILPRGSALGVVQTIGEREHSITKAQLLAQLDISYGGRIAEEIIFGKDDVTTGCSSDFQNSYNIAKNFVIQAGLSNIGFVGIDKEEMGPAMKDLIDKEIENVLEDSRKRVTRLLTQHRNELELIAQALLHHETLSGEQIEKILKTGKYDTLE